MNRLKNADGSVDSYMGLKPPKGFEKNWIPTVSGRAWFTYFRLYAPTEAHFDRTWILPDFFNSRLRPLASAVAKAMADKSAGQGSERREPGGMAT